MEFSADSRETIRAALAAGFDDKLKPDGSYVTSVNLKVEERLRELIGRHFPDHGVVGEKHPPANPQAAFQWIMDPIDGTEDFVKRVPTFGSILTLHDRGEPVVGVIDHPALSLRVSAAFGRGTHKNGERVMLSARASFIKHRDDGRLFDAVVRAHPNHRIYRRRYAHSLAAIGAADAASDYGNPIWDFAASGGKFVIVREWDVPSFGRVYSSTMGKPAGGPAGESFQSVVGAGSSITTYCYFFHLRVN